MGIEQRTNVKTDTDTETENKSITNIFKSKFIIFSSIVGVIIAIASMEKY